MATTVFQFTATIPAGTSEAAPITVGLPMDNWDVESIDLEVPPGPYGAMGFALYRSGTQVIPYQAGEWIVWDDRFANWPLDDLPTSQGWQVVGYNTGVKDHTVTVRFHVSATTPTTPLSPTVTIVQTGTPALVPSDVYLS